MATISDLNVRLGLLYKDFDKSLSAVEKKLERSGRKFSQLGNDLALSISLPLAALGAAAIKQAGEIESLKLAMVSTFETAGRSAAEATAEVEALRQAAKAPGLDFEQAVRGSVRLQNVGFSAEESRKTLIELANAIALTGGTAQELDGVTRQFAQIVSKGRILQEDITILSENMPKISSLMREAFGTANVERLREMGVTGEQFVNGITKAAAVLPRVEGGIKNALVNAAAEARNSLAKLGESIVEAFDIKGKLDAAGKALQDLTEWFDNLSDGTKNAIIQAGLFAIVLGPAIKVIGTILSTGGAVIGVIRGIGSAVAGMAGGALSAAAAWKTLNLAMKASVIGIALAVVTGLYLAFSSLSENTSAAAAAAEDLNAINKEISRTVAKEKSEIDLLVGILENETVSRDAKLKALEKLKAASPEYFGNIREENGLIIGLKESYDAWSTSIIKAAKAQAARERLVKISEEELDLAQRHEETLAELAKRQKEYADGSKNVQASVGAYAGLGEQQKLNKAASNGVTNAIKQEEDAYKSSISAIEARKAAIAKIVSENEIAAESVNKTKTKTKELTAAELAAADEAKKAGEKRADVYKKVLASIDAVNKKQSELGADFVGEKTKEIEAGVEKLIEAGFAPNSAPVQKLKGYLKDIRAGITAGLGGFSGAQAVPTLQTPQSVQSTGQSGADAGIQQAKALAEAYQKSGQAFDDFAARIAAKEGVFDGINRAIADAKNGTVTWAEAIQNSAQQITAAWETNFADIYGAAGELANNLLSLQQARAENEKAQLDEEYAGKLAAAQGNAAATAAIEAELAAKKEAIDKKVGKQQKKVAILTAIIDTALGVTKALGSAPPPYNFILAALTAAAGAVQIATIKAQPFAEGGVITKPTMGLVGEYAGATTNPEIITPERLMRSIFREESGGAGGKVQVYGVIRGSDIHISNEKATRDRGRIR